MNIKHILAGVVSEHHHNLRVSARDSPVQRERYVIRRQVNLYSVFGQLVEGSVRFTQLFTKGRQGLRELHATSFRLFHHIRRKLASRITSWISHQQRLSAGKVLETLT